MDGNSKANRDNFKWRDQVPAKIRRGLEWVLRAGDTHIKQYVLDTFLGGNKKIHIEVTTDALRTFNCFENCCFTLCKNFRYCLQRLLSVLNDYVNAERDRRRE